VFNVHFLQSTYYITISRHILIQQLYNFVMDHSFFPYQVKAVHCYHSENWQIVNFSISTVLLDGSLHYAMTSYDIPGNGNMTYSLHHRDKICWNCQKWKLPTTLHQTKVHLRHHSFLNLNSTETFPSFESFGMFAFSQHAQYVQTNTNNLNIILIKSFLHM
jgi:hypothetical protein